MLCVERLAHLIQLVVQQKEWKPIKLTRMGPPISHLFFVDDLFIFGEASIRQMEVVVSCLNLFCDASSDKVSKEKMRLFVSKNVHHSRVQKLCHFSRFQRSSELGKYLGVPLLYHRQSASTYAYIPENTQKRMSSWKVGSLAKVGRITLAQSVLAALPTYTMQTVILPKGICNKLEKMTRDFV